jgi:hypothetical protein
MIIINGSVEAFARYELRAGWFETDEAPIRSIKISRTDLNLEGQNTFLVEQAQNNSGSSLEFVQAVYSCRNSTGKLVKAGSRYIENEVLAPGATSAFKAFLFADDAQTCEIVAESDVIY